MEYAINAPKLEFNNALNSVRKNHPYAEEIIRMDRNDEVNELIHQIDSLNGPQLEEYANSLSNSNQELVFHALMKDITQTQKNKLFTIISIRMKKRFYNYNWILLQEHYNNANLIESLALIAEYIKEKIPTKYKLSLVSKLSVKDGNLVAQTLDVLQSEENTLSDFFIRYNIKNESSFARALVEEFFLHCDKEGFQRNFVLFIKEIQNHKNPPYPQISHYLEDMNVLDYVEEINNYLLNLYNDSKNTWFWDNIQDELKVKLLHWNKLKDIGKHMGIHSEKYLFWKNYYQIIEKTKYYPELRLLLFHIPGHVVVDTENEKDTSYLYKKAAFEAAFRNLDSFNNRISWSLDKDSVISTKDAILENKRSEIYELNYEGLGKLYIRDYLDANM